MSDLNYYDIPTIYSAPLVRANLAGLKTNTRRMPTAILNKAYEAFQAGRPIRLWQRESWSVDECGRRVKVSDYSNPVREFSHRLRYMATDKAPRTHSDGSPYWWNSRVSIHMPRWASRFTGINVKIWKEPVQAITEEGAGLEGLPTTLHDDICGDDSLRNKMWCSQCEGSGLYTANSLNGASPDTDCAKCDTARKMFSNVWDALHDHPSKPGQSWADNPEIYVLSYEGVNKNIDTLEGKS